MAAMVAHNDFTADQRRDDEIRELKDAIGAVQSGHVKVATGREAWLPGSNTACRTSSG